MGKKGCGGCLVYFLISLTVILVLTLGAYLCHRAYNSDTKYKGTFKRVTNENAFQKAKKGDDITVAEKKTENQFTKANKKSDNKGRSYRKGITTAIKWATFPAWAVPYLFCKDTKFRNTALMGFGMGWMMGSYAGFGGTLNQGNFWYAGLPSLLTVAVGAMVVKKVMAPPS